MRLRLPRVALLALALPACLSGFAEIHVSGGDASADRPALDRPTTDARRPSDGAPDVLAVDTPVADVISLVDGMPEDRAAAADVVDAPDVATGMDAGDAGEDAPVAMDRAELRDAMPEDRVDVVDATAACLGGCMAGEECVEGRCGRWRYALAISVEADDRRRYAAAPSGVDVAGREVCAFIARGRPVRACRRADVRPEDTSTWCQGGFSRGAIGDAELVQRVGADYVPGCIVCRGGNLSAVGGQECGNWPPTVVCCAFE